MIAWLRGSLAATLLMAAAVAFANGMAVQEGTEPHALSPAQISRLSLCVDAAVEGARPPLQNPARESLQDLLHIVPVALSVRYRSADWKSLDEVVDRALAILHARPRNLWPSVVWSEGANFRVGSFIGDVRAADGASLRMEVSGYQVCIHDSAGQAWFFRNVPIDVWP